MFVVNTRGAPLVLSNDPLPPITNVLPPKAPALPILRVLDVLSVVLPVKVLVPDKVTVAAVAAAPPPIVTFPAVPVPLKLATLPLTTKVGVLLPAPARVKVRPVAEASERNTLPERMI